MFIFSFIEEISPICVLWMIAHLRAHAHCILQDTQPAAVLWHLQVKAAVFKGTSHACKHVSFRIEAIPLGRAQCGGDAAISTTPNMPFADQGLHMSMSPITAAAFPWTALPVALCHDVRAFRPIVISFGKGGSHRGICKGLTIRRPKLGGGNEGCSFIDWGVAQKHVEIFSWEGGKRSASVDRICVCCSVACACVCT